jgi:hypothetical protein
MTEKYPQLLGAEVFTKYQGAVATKQHDLLPDILIEAAESLRANPPSGEPSDYSAGNIICIMVDTVRVINGELGTLGRSGLVEPLNPEERREQSLIWQSRLHALESLALTIGVDLGGFPQAIRDEFIHVGERSAPTVEERMLRLWKGSTPFMLEWLRWSTTHTKRSSEREEDWHTQGLESILVYCHGLRENWSPAARQTFSAYWNWHLQQSEWGRMLANL